MSWNNKEKFMNLFNFGSK